MLHPAIRTFLTVARCGSFSAAAEQLYLSKVSVMNQMNALEAELGVPLFTRTRRGAALTEAGRSFRKNAEALAALAARARQEARAAAGAVSPAVRMGVSLLRPGRPFLDWWARTGGGEGRQFQLVSFSDDTDSLSAMRAALGRTIDVFATTWSSAPCPEGTAFLPLTSCRCAVALARDHPLAAKGVLRWEDLEGQTLLLLRAGASPEIDAIRRAAARRPGIAILDFDGYYDVSVFNRCAQSGWLMEIPALWTGIHPDLVTRRVRWPYRLPFGLMHQADPPAPVRDFLECVRRRAAARPFRLPR